LKNWSPTERRCCSQRSISKRPTVWPTTSSSSTTVGDRGRTSSEFEGAARATIVEVGFADDATAQRAHGVLCVLGNCDVETASHIVSLKVDDGAKVVLDVVRALDRADITPRR